MSAPATNSHYAEFQAKRFERARAYDTPEERGRLARNLEIANAGDRALRALAIQFKCDEYIRNTNAAHDTRCSCSDCDYDSDASYEFDEDELVDVPVRLLRDPAALAAFCKALKPIQGWHEVPPGEFMSPEIKRLSDAVLKADPPFYA